MKVVFMNNEIKDMIYEIRGVQVMLDSDLAKLYNCKNGTKEINQAVKNNQNKFPERFSWILSNEEGLNLRSKILTANISSKSRVNPRVFTEQGVAMLATILKSKKAIETSIRIMDAFVSMRHFILDNKDIYKSINNINNKIVDHDEKLNYIFSKFDKNEQLILPGDYYDAYSNVLDILKTARKEIIIVDNYADKLLLDLIRNIECNITLITKDSDRLNDNEINIYNKQYNNLEVIRNNSYHDRYIIIDKKEVYLLGTSINSLGEKISMLIKIQDESVKNTIINTLK